MDVKARASTVTTMTSTIMSMESTPMAEKISVTGMLNTRVCVVFLVSAKTAISTTTYMTIPAMFMSPPKNDMLMRSCRS